MSQKSLYDLQAAIKGEAKALGTQPPANTSVPASTGQRSPEADATISLSRSMVGTTPG